MFNRKTNIYIICLSFFLFPLENTYSKQIHLSNNLDGSPGIAEMPIAGAYKDGQLNFVTSKSGPFLKNSLSFQAIPLINLKFNYEGLGDAKTMYYSSSGYTTWDRSVDLRFDLANEKQYTPSISLGLKDFAGTGRNSSEYLVFTKTHQKKLRYSLGLGWGRLGSKNIIGNTGIRSRKGNSQGGDINIGHYFRGDVGLFGGIEYNNPKVKNLILGAELSSDNLESVKDYTSKLPKSSINYSIKYKISNGFHLGGYWVRGQSTGIHLNIKANPTDYNGGDYLELAPEPFYSHPLPNSKINSDFWENLLKELRNQYIRVVSYGDKKNEVTLVIDNYHYQSDAQAVGRTLRVLSKYAPIEKKTFTVIISSFDIPVSKFSMNRHEISSIVDAPNAELLSKKIVKYEDSQKHIYDLNLNKVENKFNWSLYPYYRFHLFDPNQPVYYDFGARLKLNQYIKPGIIIRNTIEQSMISSFDEIWRGKKGKLPHVRTELKNYLNVQDTRIRDLTVSSYFKLNPSSYGRITLGYLEPMYSGLSLETLKFNKSSKVAIGAELNFLRAREFRQLLGHRSLPGLAKINGHISAYLDTGYKDYYTQLDIGRYLAGDNGGTFTLTRKFPNGWDIGGFFTLTDASFSDFGEGSFDKGIFMKLPFNAILPYNSRSFIYEKIRPIQGDGGSRVMMEGRLYSIIEPRTKNNTLKTWGRLWR